MAVDVDGSGIYAIVHIASGRKYVGSATKFSGRWKVHRSELRKNKHHSAYLQRAWSKYGEDAFDFVILETCERSNLIEREQCYIDEMQPAFNCCKTAGSTAGRRASPESRAKMRAAHKGRPGRPWTEETREKQRSVQTGKKRSPEVRAKLRAQRRNHPPPVVSEDGRRRIAAAARGNKHCVGRVLSEETKSKIAAALMGRPGTAWSDERKKRMSELKRGKKRSAETVAKMKAAMVGRKPPPITEEGRRKISAARMGNCHWRGRKHTPEAIENMRAAQRRRRRTEQETLKWQL